MPLGGPQLAKIRDAFGSPAPAAPIELSERSMDRLAEKMATVVERRTRVLMRQGVA